MSKERITIDGEGSTVEVERGRVYRIRHRLPPAEPGGKRKWSKQRTVHGNKAKARIELEAYRTELEDMLNNEHMALKVGAYAREFHQRRLDMGTLSPLSLERDEIEIARIEEHFGNVPVQDLDVATINEAYTKMRKSGTSASALHKTHQKLSQVMKRAVKEEIILRNPCDLIDDVKRPEAAERRSLSAEQAMQLALDLKECERSGRIVAVWLALATGVRRGEALGLVWGNVDLARKRIRIQKQLDSKGVHRDPKSHKSKRNLAIDDGTIAFLAEWKIIQSDLLYQGGDVPDDAAVCSNDTDGNFISPAAFDKWRRAWFVDHDLGTFEKVEVWHDRNGVKRYRRSGYKGYNLHELRHTQATLLIGSGADIKTVQNRLGHSSASLTMNIYAHAIEQNDRGAADIIGNSLKL
mgnify:FL=1